MRTPHSIMTKWLLYPLVLFITSINLRGICRKLFFNAVKYSIGHILAMVDLVDVKRKGVHRLHAGPGQLYDLDLWPHPWPWPWIFKVKFENSCVSRMGGPIDMEWKVCESIVHESWPLPWWGGWMQQIVTRVTLDFGLLLAHLIIYWWLLARLQ